MIACRRRAHSHAPFQHPYKVTCSNCNLRDLCMPVGLSDERNARIDEMVGTRRKVKRGDLLFSNGEPFTSCTPSAPASSRPASPPQDGRDQVTGFQMAGEIVGLDGIVHDHHTCDAIALEDAEVCVLPL